MLALHPLTARSGWANGTHSSTGRRHNGIRHRARLDYRTESCHMGTSSIVRLVPPSSVATPDVVIVVRYDGNDGGDEIDKMVRRDGYDTVYETFRKQPSRNWMGLDTGVGSGLPDYVTSFPQNVAVSAAVEGYGVLYVADQIITPETIGDGTGWERDCIYIVNREGKPRNGR
ncbi:hypothetical protein [Rhodococcus baikonurensis]|uniref:Uncharacterized protein n=1 Tax=Rhodococcus baikonurensis TaxID=172041 RepID=A0ABV5XT57_9NOCA